MRELMNVLNILSIIILCSIPIEIGFLLLRRGKTKIYEITGNADQEYYQHIMSIQLEGK